MMTQSQGSSTLFWPPRAPGMHTEHRYPCTWNEFVFKNRFVFSSHLWKAQFPHPSILSVFSFWFPHYVCVNELDKGLSSREEDPSFIYFLILFIYSQVLALQLTTLRGGSPGFQACRRRAAAFSGSESQEVKRRGCFWSWCVCVEWGTSHWDTI